MTDRAWTDKRHFIIIAIAGLFLLISAAAFMLGYHQYKSAIDKDLVSDRTSADIFAELIKEHQNATIGILESYASRSLLVSAVKKRDAAGVLRHMADLKHNNSEMDLTFLTDERGILWVNFPVFPEAIGKNLSGRDWYKGISANWKPYTSTVFQLIVGKKSLAVAACVPVFDEKRKVIGILANSHRLVFLDSIFSRIRLDRDATVSVIDQAGNIVHSSKFSEHDRVIGYPFYAGIRKALSERRVSLEIDDLGNGNGNGYLVISPIESLGWTVIVERSLNDILLAESLNFTGIAIIAALLFLLISVFILYQYSLHRKAFNLLQITQKLVLSEERYKRMVERESLEAQNRQLQKTESLGRMAGAIAHTFNNQLQTVMLCQDMTRKDLSSLNGPIENLEKACEATRKVSEVSSLLLTYLGQAHGKLEPLDISIVCRQHLPILRAIIPQNIELDAELPSPGPIIRGNANMIQQIVTNLSSNAWEAIGDRDGTIRLSVKKVAASDVRTENLFPVEFQLQPAEYVCLEISDTGCGIAPSDIEKLFDPFYSTRFTGRGMGLPVVLGIVRAHRGAIMVESEPGRGSSFRVYLPAVEDDA